MTNKDMILNCYNEFLLIVICVLLAVIVSLLDKENAEAITLLLLLYGCFIALTVCSTGAICKTFMDKYINQSCPNYIRLLIEIIGTFSIPVIVAIITMVIMLRKHNWMK